MPTRTDCELGGFVAIVSGASRGIGLAVAQACAARGARLVLVARDPASLSRAGHLIEAAAECVTVAGDIAAPVTAERAVDTAMRRYGRIDLLFNIAGAFPTASIEDSDEAFLDGMIAANLKGTFLLSRAALPALRAAGRGAIVNMSSMAARFPTPGLTAYSASKAGVEAFTRSLAAEVAPAVRVNAVAAGPTLTEAVRDLLASDTTGAVAAVTRGLPLGRLAEPEEIAEVAIFLASPRASCMTGQVVHANSGGLMA